MWPYFNVPLEGHIKTGLTVWAYYTDKIIHVKKWMPDDCLIHVPRKVWRYQRGVIRSTKTWQYYKVIARFSNKLPSSKGVTIHFFHKRYVSRYLICITIRITIHFIGNCNYSLRSMLVVVFFLYEVAYVPAEIINIWYLIN